jgi:serine/threonine-protein kinase
MTMSPDGQFLAFDESSPDTGSDIWVMSLDGEREPQVFLQTKFNERAMRFSPDGRWLAYTSDESGRNEVYVRPFPKAEEAKWQISTGGGGWQLWARNGRELVYRSGNRMMTVDITTEPSFSPSKPRLLFETPRVRPRRDFAVTPDGQSFLIVQAGEHQEETRQFNVVLNSFEELKRLVPTDN